MNERVVLTGIGCVSCFGIGHEPFMAALAAGASGVAPVARFDTSSCHSHRAALITGFDPSAFIPPLKLRRVDAVGRVALASTRLLLDDGGVAANGNPDIGIALGTYTAGLDSLVEYLGGLTDNGPTGVPAILFSNTVSNAPASLCAIEHGLHGPNVTFNQREASSLAALLFSVGAIRDGRTTGMITGGADCVEETFFKTHDRFRSTSPMRGFAPDDEASRPFDRCRSGFVLGEGGFLVLLESASAASQRGARVYGEIIGVGAAAAPTSLNEWPSDGSGALRAMRLALADAQVAPDEVAAVMAAANGSPQLDRLEAGAIHDLFGDRAVTVASIKGAIGESGAAGAASLIAGLLSIAGGTVPPTVGLRDVDPACRVNVSPTARPAAGDVFLVNSVATGGTLYSLAIRAARR